MPAVSEVVEHVQSVVAVVEAHGPLRMQYDGKCPSSMTESAKSYRCKFDDTCQVVAVTVGRVPAQC